MGDNDSRIKASLQLFNKLGCCSSDLNGDVNNVETALALVDVDKMRCHIINCLAALHMVEDEEVLDEENYKLGKSKVFNAAISMILDDEVDSN
jgi:hypothetical protein